MTEPLESDYIRDEQDSLLLSLESGALCDGDGLSSADTRILGRLGLFPRASFLTPSGAPYISDIDKYRALHFDWDAVQSEMNKEDPLALTIDYTRMMMGFLLYHPHPARIEMIGLGGGSLAKLCHYLLPRTDISVVEIDLDVIALRDRFFVPRDDERFRVIHADGADYVRRSEARPDVVLVDGFDIDGQPPQLCSPAFYRHCRNRLTSGGVMIANLWGGDRNLRNHLAHLRECFDGSLVAAPTERGTNQVAIARKSLDLRLSSQQISDIAKYFPQRQAAFLPSIGGRIREAVDRIAR